MTETPDRDTLDWDTLDWDREKHGRMADYATAPEDEPTTVSGGDETGD